MQSHKSDVMLRANLFMHLPDRRNCTFYPHPLWPHLSLSPHENRPDLVTLCSFSLMQAFWDPFWLYFRFEYWIWWAVKWIWKLNSCLEVTFSIEIAFDCCAPFIAFKKNEKTKKSTHKIIKFLYTNIEETEGGIEREGEQAKLAYFPRQFQRNVLKNCCSLIIWSIEKLINCWLNTCGKLRLEKPP